MRTYAPDAHAQARAYCEQAIALDPAYAAPHALLGYIHFHSTHAQRQPVDGGRGCHSTGGAAGSRVGRFRNRRAFRPGRSGRRGLDYDWAEATRELQIALANPSAPAEAHWARAIVLSTFRRFRGVSHLDAQGGRTRCASTFLWARIPDRPIWSVAASPRRRSTRAHTALQGLQAPVHPRLAMAEAGLALTQARRRPSPQPRPRIKILPSSSIATRCLGRRTRASRADGRTQASGSARRRYAGANMSHASVSPGLLLDRRWGPVVWRRIR